MLRFDPAALRPAACIGAIPFEAALAHLAAAAEPLGREPVPLAKAGRRVLAESVIARLDAPRRDAAAMDGYAVARADLLSGRRRLRVVGDAFPGQPFGAPLSPGDAVRIFTGASLPEGADTVIVQEGTRRGGEFVLVQDMAGAKPHVRTRGSDFRAGETLVPAGRVIGPGTMVAAAAADVSELTVFRRPKVCVIATGDELVPPGRASADADRSPESLTEALLLMVRQAGGRPGDAVVLPDRLDQLSVAAQACLRHCDVLVLVGGASAGERDLAKASLAGAGLDLRFASVNMKPGKPAWYGRVGAAHVLGLPGNPTAAMTTARLFLVPLLHALGGRPFATPLRWSSLPSITALPAVPDRDLFLCAWQQDDSVEVLARQEASSQRLLAAANALVWRRAGSAPAAAGEPVKVIRF